MPKVESIIIKNFKSNTGYIFDNISLSYQLYGQKIGDSPIILVNHSLTGNSSLTGDSGWWSEIVGTDKAIDLKYFTVIAFDIPGNGYYYPTIENYAELNCNDIARIFYLGLEKIGISSLFAIVGGSIGGGITWEMASLKNKFAKNQTKPQRQKNASKNKVKQPVIGVQQGTKVAAAHRHNNDDIGRKVNKARQRRHRNMQSKALTMNQKLTEERGKKGGDFGVEHRNHEPSGKAVPKIGVGWRSC